LLAGEGGVIAEYCHEDIVGLMQEMLAERFPLKADNRLILNDATRLDITTRTDPSSDGSVPRLSIN
jgi:hypothetical protein